MELSALYRIFLECPSVTTDSRNCPKGALFVALKGDSFDGNAFAAKALAEGCAYVVVDEAEYFVENDPRYILVENGLYALQQLANHHRRQLHTPVIGITGTNGKTTTKELMAAVLSQSHRTLYTEGNLNNHIGVPLTLLRLKAEHELAIIEMGASHPGDIEELTRIAEPDYGLITNVGKAHLEGFGSFEGVVRTKGELYDFLRTKANATIFVHDDNPHLKAIAGGLNRIAYGSGDDLYISGHAIGNSPYLTFEWKAGRDGERHEVRTQLIGEYNLPNALAAVAVGRYFGVDAGKIDSALSGYTPRNNRSQLRRTESNTLIVDAYNANPTSMAAAIENFRRMDAPHKMVILGDMRELGEASGREHQRIADCLAGCGFEEVWLVGKEFAATRQSFRTFSDVNETIEAIQADKPHGRTILIKGSNGIRLYQAADYL